MNIKDLNIDEITHLLKPYLINHFKGCKISNANENLFTESYLFDYEEIANIIPIEYRNRFNKSDKFNGVSGFIEFDVISKNLNDKEYTALLLVNAVCGNCYV